MATIARPTKVAGGTSVVDGTVGYAADWNGDIDTIYTDYNGNITNANLSASAAVAGTKVAQNALLTSTSSPGESDSPNASTSIERDIEQLRYQIQRLGVGSNAKLIATGFDAGWFDFPPKGPNLILNGALLATQTSSGAPDY